jgi:hypothetical protein
MAFGIKIKRIKTANNYTIEEFFEAIKDKPFTAGEPFLTKHGFIKMIAFPALDSRNQVQIIYAGKNKFQVQKSEEAGIGNAVANSVIDDLTGGISGLKGMVGKNSKRCEELVDITVKELEALGL